MTRDCDLAEILEEFPEPRGPILEAMLLLRQCRRDMETRPQEDHWFRAFRAAESISADGQDPDLYAMFLANWAAASMLAGRNAEVAAMLKQARSVIGRETPPEVVVLVMETEGVLAGMMGDKARREEISLACLEMLAPGSPSFSKMLISHAFFLGQLGRESEIDSRLDGVTPRQRPQATLARFFQAVETGNATEALRLHAALRVKELSESVMGRNISSYKEMLDLMLGRWMRRALPAPAEGEVSGWLLIVDHLLFGRPEQALELARADAAEYPHIPVAGIGPNSFNLLRAELANGNAQAARRLIERRHAAGNRRYLDDLFLARIGLLDGNEPAAARHFAALLDSCDRYRAHGRMDLELRMACELSPGELARLGAMAGEVRARRSRSSASLPPDAVVREASSVGAGRYLGPSRAAAEVRDQVLRFAPLDAPVLVTGETGTGKELVARALHEEGPRRTEPFLAVNCGAITESLLESELFGHERGAFTGASRARRGLFEEAGRGTLLLDEIGEIPSRLQAALLRVLETGEVRPVGSSRPRKAACRVVAATNADLEALSARGLFRADLLFRLHRLAVRIAPLRERREDVLPLAEHFLADGRRDGRRAVLSAELRDELQRRPWPGNVRELRNLVERMRLLGSDKLAYGVGDLEPARASSGSSAESAQAMPAGAGPEPEVAARESGAPRASGEDRAPLRDDAAIRRYLDDQGTSLRRLERLRELFRRYRRLNRKEVARILGVSPVTATRDLRSLCREGFIEKVMPSASARTHHFALRSDGGRGETQRTG